MEAEKWSPSWYNALIISSLKAKQSSVSAMHITNRMENEVLRSGIKSSFAANNLDNIGNNNEANNKEKLDAASRILNDCA